MNVLCIVVFACVLVAASAGILGYGHGYGHGYSHGYGHLPVVGASGVVTSSGAAGPSGVVTGHGAIGPNGEHNSLHDGYGIGYGAWGHDNGQWHGEGLLASQAWTGHHAGIIGHGLGLGVGVGHWGHGHW